MNRPIYLDYNATTPIDPLVLEAMLPFFREAFGNASSTSHSYGWEANQAVEKARQQVAQLIHSAPENLFWTSGATESNNLAILGAIRPFLERGQKTHVITTLIEHKAVLDVARRVEKEGAEVTYLAPDAYGKIQTAAVTEALRPHTRLVSVIMGQNEIGTINPIEEIGSEVKGYAQSHKTEILFHSDAAQAVGKTFIDVDRMRLDFLSASGHKIYAPKGIGFLFTRKDVELSPLFWGGSQERGVRPGTLNVPGIVAMGKACEICSESMDQEIPRLTRMRDDFIQRVLSAAPMAHLNGHPKDRLYSNISLTFDGLAPEVFPLRLSGLAISSGSACAAGAPSHVLKALGLTDRQAKSTIRIGIGRMTTPADLETAAKKIVAMTQNASSLSTHKPQI